jgi:hypothetical protein
MAAADPKHASPENEKTVINGSHGYGFGGWSWLAAGIFLLGVLLAVTGRPIYDKYRSYQAQQAAAKIMTALDEERWEIASAMLSAELPKNRADPGLLRAMAD